MKFSHIYRGLKGASQAMLEVKNPPANTGNIRDAGIILLEEDMATHSSSLTWRIPWTEEPARLQSAAPAAKSLQSCSTLCDPIDGSPPGFPILRILQARTLE